MRRAEEWGAGNDWTLGPAGASVSVPGLRALPAEAGAISTARLRHKVPRQAEKAYTRATELARGGKHMESSRELEKAVQIDPEYADAYNDLGIQYLFLGHVADARRELLRAVELDPAFAVACMNLARLELQTNDLTAAEQHARRALVLSGSAQARQLLDSIQARKIR